MTAQVNGRPFWGWGEDLLRAGVRLDPPAAGPYPPLVTTSAPLPNGRYKVRFIGGDPADVAFVAQGKTAQSTDYPMRSSDDPVYIRILSKDNNTVSCLFPDTFGFLTVVPVDDSEG